MTLPSIELSKDFMRENDEILPNFESHPRGINLVLFMVKLCENNVDLLKYTLLETIS